MKRTVKGTGLALIAAAVLLGGCASRSVMVAPQPPAQYQRLGEASGEACGSHGVVSTAYYVVPMGLHGRVQKAYDAAVASVPGAVALVDVTMQENWFWWVIGTARCVKIKGVAVK